METDIRIRLMVEADISVISSAFNEQGWCKPESQYVSYFLEQNQGLRSVLVAELNNEFAGYITIQWNSEDSYFSSRNIPELKDFNVLKKYQRLGIGSKLMNEAEDVAFTKTKTLGLSVGLISGYGSAQRMYIKRGYLPTGEGLKSRDRVVEYFDNVVADDDLILSFIKVKTTK